MKKNHPVVYIAYEHKHTNTTVALATTKIYGHTYIAYICIQTTPSDRTCMTDHTVPLIPIRGNRLKGIYLFIHFCSALYGQLFLTNLNR